MNKEMCVEQDDECRALSRRFFDALEHGDSETIATCYAADIRIWNNAQQVEMTGAEHIAGLESFFFTRFLSRVYQDRRTDLLADGFVQQQVLAAEVGGALVRIPMCLVCRVTDGRISRIDEYLTMSEIPEM